MAGWRWDQGWVLSGGPVGAHVLPVPGQEVGTPLGGMIGQSRERVGEPFGDRRLLGCDARENRQADRPPKADPVAVQ